jgi:DNA-binding transcriptional MerR regulator
MEEVLREIDEPLREINEALREMEEARREINEARREMKEVRKEIDESLREMKEVRKEINEPLRERQEFWSLKPGDCLNQSRQVWMNTIFDKPGNGEIVRGANQCQLTKKKSC